jgi:hypothetical protein
VNRAQRIISLAATALVLAAAAAPASAQIFFDDPASENIGTAALDGRTGKAKLVHTRHPWAVAADDEYVYWARYYCCGGKPQYIGRARRDGTHVDQSFITVTGGSGSGIDSIAVDRSHVYWTDDYMIGRANRNGTNVQPSFIAFDRQTEHPASVQVSGGKLYFFFSGVVSKSIGRVSADGSGLDTAYVPGVGGSALAVDARHLYWTQGQTRSIARSKLDGSKVDEHFLDVRAQGLAVGAGHIFWATYPTGVIGRASLDGTHVNRRFVRRIKHAHTLAVVR